jgi:hypothetical protein
MSSTEWIFVSAGVIATQRPYSDSPLKKARQEMIAMAWNEENGRGENCNMASEVEQTLSKEVGDKAVGYKPNKRNSDYALNAH